jgi:hypothetical protein
VDDVQRGAVIRWVRPPFSIASCRRGGGRLERVQAQVRFGLGRGRRSGADKTK